MQNYANLKQKSWVLYRVQWCKITRMAKSMAKIRHTTTRNELLDIMIESRLFAGRREARAALGAVCVALRNWLIAMSARPPKSVMSRLTVPGVGAIRIAWYEYGGRYAPAARVRFGPTKKVRDQIAAVNKKEFLAWKASRYIVGVDPAEPDADQTPIADAIQKRMDAAVESLDRDTEGKRS
jgi:hypothetical protein